jgi:hypothetical protein
MATRVDENSQPALRLIGRNLNPLVANVFPPAFAIKFKKQRDNQVQDSFTELFRLHGTGIRTRGLPAGPGALPCSPAGIPAASNLSKINHRSEQADKLLLRLYSLDVVPGGIQPAKLFPSRPATSVLT